MSSDHRGGGTIRFFFHLNNQLYSIVGCIETSGEQKRVFFEGIQRWLVFGYIWSIWWWPHKLSHFNLQVFIFDFTWNCCRLRKPKKFSTIPGQFKCYWRNQISCIHRGSLKTESLKLQN